MSLTFTLKFIRFSKVLFIKPKDSKGFPGDSILNKLPVNTGDTGDAGLLPGSGRPPGERNGKPLSESGILRNPMHRGVLWATVHRVTKNWT